jgi:hypothetical protein
VQDDLHLSNSALGLALLGVPAGSVAASAVLPSMLPRSTRRIIVAALPASAGALCLLAVAPSQLTLAAGLLVFGVATGAVDVAMNAHAVVVQRRLAASAFGRWHAMWSAGGFAGAALGALVVAAGLSPLRHFVVVTIATAGVTAVLVPGLADSGPVQERTHRSWTANPQVLLLAAVALAGFVVEVAAADWGGVFLRRDLHAGATVAAAAFAVVALPHFLVRLTGDPLISRWPARRLMAGGLIAAAMGYTIVVTSTAPLVALLGLAVVGTGVALVVPVAFAAAGNVPGVSAGAGVATAAGISYLGWAATPPAVGAIAGAGGVRTGLVLPLLVAVVVAALTRLHPWNTGSR